MATSTNNIEKKIENFRNTPTLRSNFEKQVQQAPFPAILWPHEYTSYFHNKYIIVKNKKAYVYPIYNLVDRLHCANIKLENIAHSRYKECHPSLLYFYIFHFEKQLLSYKKTLSSLKEKYNTQHLIQETIKLKKKIDVPSHIKKIKNRDELLSFFFFQFQEINNKYVKKLSENQNLTIELDTHKQELENEKSSHKNINNIIYQNKELQFALKGERKIITHLEKELKRVSEQFLSMHSLDRKSSLFEEYQNLRNEYNTLAEKNDNLVSQNIELANQLKNYSNHSTTSLAKSLHFIRERINSLIKKEIHNEPKALIESLQKEISLLKETRLNLGHASYNIGLLFLRNGEIEKGLIELRASQELGVKDKKINELIYSLRNT